MERPPRIPVWLPLDRTVSYFITFCVADRRPTLNNLEVFGAVLKFCYLHEDWQTLAAVVMPDHFHALVRPRASRDAKITQYSAGLKRFVRRETKAAWKWQDGVFDRLLRRDESAGSKWIYMRENPVRAGLVERWEDWPYAIGITCRACHSGRPREFGPVRQTI